MPGDGRRGGGHRRHDDRRGRAPEALPARGLHGRARGGRADQLPHARRAQRGAGRRVVRAQDRRGQNDSGTAQRRLQPHGGERGGGGEGGVVGWRRRVGEGGGEGGDHVLIFKDNVGKTSERLVGAHIGFSERTDTTFS